MNKVEYYLAHDPIGNMEWQITNYDKEALRKAESSGIIIIAVGADGSREKVLADDVVEPESDSGSIVIVQPQYVDDRMDAVIEAFDALRAAMMPELTLMSTDNEQDEPLKRFSAAVSELWKFAGTGSRQ